MHLTIGDEQTAQTLRLEIQESIATHGSVEEFSGKGWSSWAERLQFYFHANGIADDVKKRAMLLTLCGPTAFEGVKALLAPGTPSDHSFEVIVSLQLRVPYDPQPSDLFSRCKFQRLDQLPHETVTAYVAALKALAAICNFGTLPSQPSSQPPRPSTSESSRVSAAMSPAFRPDVRSTMLPIDVMVRVIVLSATCKMTICKKNWRTKSSVCQGIQHRCAGGKRKRLSKERQLCL